MSRNKARGTAVETGLVNYLREWFPYARRLALAGARDVGDVGLGDGFSVTLECKATAAQNWAVELDEALAEQVNAGTEFAFLVRKRRGKGDPAQWYAMTTVEQMARLLLLAHATRADVTRS